jgi:hypothetical protein
LRLWITGHHPNLVAAVRQALSISLIASIATTDLVVASPAGDLGDDRRPDDPIEVGQGRRSEKTIPPEPAGPTAARTNIPGPNRATSRSSRGESGSHHEA